MEVTVIVSSTGVTISVPNGNNGVGVPAGGTTDQVLAKLSNTSYDTGWVDASGLPAGGTVDQWLQKQSSTPGDASWVDFPTIYGIPAGGTTGQALLKYSDADYLAAWVDIPLFNTGNSWNDTNNFNGFVNISAGMDLNAGTIRFVNGTEIQVFGDMVLQMNEITPPDGQVLTSSGTSGMAIWADPAPVKNLVVTCKNTSGATIAKGSAVKINSDSNGFPIIVLAQANAILTSNAVGITSTAIANNATGLVVVNGLIETINTSAFTSGDRVYLSTSTAGALQYSIPTKPNIVVQIGTVAYAHSTLGKILVEPIISSVPVSNIYDSTTTGDALLQTASASAARTTLGSTTVGDAVFIAANAAAARTAIGLTYSVDTQTFDASGTWTKPAGAVTSTIVMSGGGAGGMYGTSTTGGISGAAGEGFTNTVPSSLLATTESVTIGAGGNGDIGSTSTAPTFGSSTTFNRFAALGSGAGTVASTGVNIKLNQWVSNSVASTNWGGGNSASLAGRVGGSGAGGGGGGGTGGANGSAGGAANDWTYAPGATSTITVGLGGGASGGTTPTGTGSNGSTGTYGFGSGAGGGGGTATASQIGGTGGAGVRGSGGGGGGRCGTGAVNSNGGSGGNGFAIITTVCYS